MKKSSFFAVIALVALAGFLFTACPQEGEETPPAATTYTVTFNTGAEGPSVPSVTVNSGEKIKKPENPTKGTYGFVAWYKDSAFKSAWDFDKDTVTADTSLYAKWLARVTVQNTKEGTADVAAVYTLTISKQLAVGETLTVTNVGTRAVTYSPNTETAASAQATAIATAIKNAIGGLYKTTAQGSVITLTAQTAGIITEHPDTKVSPSIKGKAAVAETTPGSDSAAALYTLTISRPLTDEETLTLTNVVDGDVVTYTPAEADTTATKQAAAIVALFTGENKVETTYTVAIGETNKYEVTFTAAATGVVDEENDPKAVVTTSAAPVGTVPVATLIPGLAAVPAEYTLTVNSPLPVGEILTITDVVPEKDITYTPAASGADTAAVQAGAIKKVLDKDAALGLYTTAVKGSVITLKAKTGGVIENVPTATVTVAPEEEEQTE